MKLTPKINPDETERKPVCDFCNSEDVRIWSGAYGRPGEPWYVEPSYVCIACFLMHDDGPCFDDLPAPEQAG